MTNSKKKLKPQMFAAYNDTSYYLQPHANVIWLMICLSVVIVFLGSAMKFDDSKYVKMNQSSTCKNSILSIYVQDSEVCCDDTDSMVCTAFSDSVNKVFSSRWSFVIPIIPFLLASAAEFVYSVSSTTFDFDKPLKHCLYSVRRLIIYFIIAIVRMCILYLFADELATLYYSTFPNQESCWCSDLVSPNKCKLHFDFSDHIVLAIVQYILPCSLELHYILFKSNSSEFTWRKRINNSSEAQDQKPDKEFIQLLASIDPIYTPAVCSAFAIIVLNLRSMLTTCMFFHTRAENLVGLVIALSSLVPLVFYFEYWVALLS